MAAVRRSLHPFLAPSFETLRYAFLMSSLNSQSRVGHDPGRFRRGFGGTVASEVGTDIQPCNLDAVKAGDEIEKIRHEFEEAKRSFLKIPVAIKEMPKMNPKGIYVNKNLRLDTIQVYGFDYDYTLAHYSENLQSLIYDLAKKHLVNELKYPESCLQFEYDPTFPIRGLYYDRLKGCLLKLDFFGSIETDGCFFGRHKLSLEKIKEMYGTRHIGRDQARGLVGLMDFFCFSEACLIADIVQHFVDAKLDFDASYVYEDVNHAIQRVHRSGLAHKEIIADPHKYLVKNVSSISLTFSIISMEKIVSFAIEMLQKWYFKFFVSFLQSQLLCFLKMLKQKGKKLFLLTNSPYSFVDGGMRFMLEDHSGDRNSWRELFDVVIAQANKPSFYTSDHPFRCYDIEKDTLAFTAVDRFIPNQVYYHGCLKSFLQITKWKGPEVIYFGDHLFSDLRGPAKAGWRTAAIIHELESEIEIQNDESYRFQQAKFHIIQELLGKVHATVVSSKRGTACRALLDELNEQRRQCRSAMRRMFNRSFGATFLTDTGRESAFSYHIHQYADVYTSKPENFMLYPPKAWLHVPYDIKIMPHHVKVPSSLFKIW
ncbi:5'-nucleotidase domain-containing protein DDB_G0275467 isoform X2 [Phoenix dactylifera]|uniref:5'-nucleotidase domain-containing protein DDB_G0275467 isoform X2 n=1 Tax=Phoenix dactylifera TaxID=42345 RepID=A0A8B9A5D3_PHODC|nr:5'-nucleotidase domain-containing protein DDB_G0275467 isoform X2 [Phoenix dactylifera]